jgi:lipoprotein-anchoring transpeptidase ErfK/SrfK
MKKFIIASGLTVFFLIFGSFSIINIRENVVYPLQDAAYLQSNKAVEDAKALEQKIYSFDMTKPITWNSKPVNNVIPTNLLAELKNQEEENVLGDTSGNWIEVILSTQTLCFHETNGQTPCWKISSGMPWTPTPTGNFHVWTKIPVQTMQGPGYFLPGVHWVMYFYQAYSTHEAYWHNNFGNPMSHGCVNMTLESSKYIYDRSEVGTLVSVRN